MTEQGKVTKADVSGWENKAKLNTGSFEEAVSEWERAERWPNAWIYRPKRWKALEVAELARSEQEG